MSRIRAITQGIVEEASYSFQKIWNMRVQLPVVGYWKNNRGSLGAQIMLVFQKERAKKLELCHGPGTIVKGKLLDQNSAGANVMCYLGHQDNRTALF